MTGGRNVSIGEEGYRTERHDHRPEDGGQGAPLVPGPGRRVPPWPSDHEPATAGERRLWESYEDLRTDPHGDLSQKLVAERIGMSRTPLSVGKGGFAILRREIRDEVARRLAEKTRHRPNPTADEGEAVRRARTEQNVRYWKSEAQRADSQIVAVVAEATREKAARRNAVRMLRRVFDDIRDGRWVRSDPDDALLLDLRSFLTGDGEDPGSTLPSVDGDREAPGDRPRPARRVSSERRSKPGLRNFGSSVD